MDWEDEHDNELFEISQIFEEDHDKSSNNADSFKLWTLSACRNGVNAETRERLLSQHGAELFPKNFTICDVTLSSMSDPQVLKNLFLTTRTSVLKLKSLRQDQLTDAPKERAQVSRLLHYVINYIEDLEDDSRTINGYIGLIQSLLELESFVPNVGQFQKSNSALGQEQCVKFQYSHGYFEWRLLLLIIAMRQELRGESLGSNHVHFKKALMLFIYDLIMSSVKCFDQENITENLHRSAFACSPCLTELWEITCEMVTRLNRTEMGPNFEDLLMEVWNFVVNPQLWSSYSVERSFCVIKHRELVFLWVFRHLPVNVISDQFSSLTSNIVSLLSSNPVDMELKVACNEIWLIGEDHMSIKVDVVINLWELFYKRINTNFVIMNKNTSMISSLLVANDSPISYVNTVQQVRQKGDHHLLNRTSYEIFLMIVAKQLQSEDSAAKKDQQKLINRVLLKFSSKMWLTLTEMGIHNVMSLIVTIWYHMASDEKTLDRIETILLAIPPLQDFSDQTRRLAVAKGLLAILIMTFTHHNRSSKQYSVSLMQKIGSSLENNRQLGRMMFHTIDTIANASESFNNGEQIMFDNWMGEYLKICSSNDRDIAFDILNRMMEKYMALVASGGSLVNGAYILGIYQCLESYLLTTLTSDDHIDSSELISNICLCLPESADSIFAQYMFVNANDTEFQVDICRRIAKKSNSFTGIQGKTWIKAWIKCLITNTNNDIQDLTQFIVNLDDYRDFCSTGLDDYVMSSQPFTVFLTGISKKYLEAQTEFQKEVFSAKFEQYFDQYTRWSLPCLQKSPESAHKIYSNSTAMIFLCGPIMYNSKRPHNFFKCLISDFYLTTSLLSGHKQSVPIIQAISKIFHIFAESMHNLITEGDAYSHKTLCAFVLHWTPQLIEKFNTAASGPFVRILRNRKASLVNLVFGAISTNWLIPKSQKDMIAISLYKDILRQVQNDDGLIVLLLNQIFDVVCEHYCNIEEFAVVKRFIIELFEAINKSPAFQRSIQAQKIVEEALLKLTKMIHHKSSVFFELMLKLCPMFSSIIRIILPKLRNSIVEMEYRRGTGHDMRIRQKLANLESIILRQQHAKK